MVFDLGFEILNMHRSRRDFFPPSRKAINEIKIHYLHLNSITTCNLIFGCFLIFSFYTSLQNYPPSHTWGPWRLHHFSPYLSRKILTEMRCELCARVCLTDSKFASHFWLLEGVWKTTGRWDASYNESQCEIYRCFSCKECVLSVFKTLNSIKKCMTFPWLNKIEKNRKHFAVH